MNCDHYVTISFGKGTVGFRDWNWVNFSVVHFYCNLSWSIAPQIAKQIATQGEDLYTVKHAYAPELVEHVMVPRVYDILSKTCVW